MRFFKQLIFINVALILLITACHKKETIHDPQILSFSPASGAKDTVVTIQGYFSTDGTPVVKFGGVTATDIVSASGTEIKVKVPQDSVAGEVKITVTIAGKELVSDEFFTVEPNTWMKTFGSAPKGDETAKGVISTADGGYIFLSQIYIYIPGENTGDVTEWKGYNDMWLLKVDRKGNKQWVKTIGGSGMDEAGGITKCTDGGFAIVGTTEKSSTGDVVGQVSNYSMRVIKLDPNGSIVWNKEVAGTNGRTSGYAIDATSDGGFIAVGSFTDNANPYDDMFIVKLDGNGNILWSKTVSESRGSIESALAVTLTPDGSYVVVGQTETSKKDFMAVKLSATGDVIWQKTMGGSADEGATCVTTAPDGGYIVAGYTYSNDGDVSGNHGDGDIWTVKLDENGNTVWKKTFGGSGKDWAYGITESVDNQLAVVATTYSNNSGDVVKNNGAADVWLIKFAPDGKLTGQQLLGKNEYDNGYGITTSPGGGYVIAAGTSYTDLVWAGGIYSGTGKNVLAIKTNEPR